MTKPIIQQKIQQARRRSTQTDEYQHHAAQLTKLADMMERAGDDHSRKGQLFLCGLRMEYRTHLKAMKRLKPENFKR